MATPATSKNTEEVILEAAKRIFQQKGYAGTRMQEVADAAGINKAMLHYYFRSKEKLFRMILTQAMSTVSPMLLSAISSEKDVMGKMEDLVHGYLRILRSQPHLPLFIVHELSQNQGAFIRENIDRAAHGPAALGFFQQVMDETEAGKIRPINPVSLMMNVMSMIVFPFIARPMMQTLSEVTDRDFDQLMNDRAEEIISFVRAAIRV